MATISARNRSGAATLPNLGAVKRKRLGRHLKYAAHGDPRLQWFETSLENRISFRVADDRHDTLRAARAQNVFGRRRYHDIGELHQKVRPAVDRVCVRIG